MLHGIPNTGPCNITHHLLGMTRHGKSGDLGDPGSRTILKITDDLNKSSKFLQKNIQTSKQMPFQVKRGYNHKKGYLRLQSDVKRPFIVQSIIGAR